LVRGKANQEQDSAVAKNRLSKTDMTAGLENLQATSDIETARDADLVIEAVFESMSVKREISATLDDLCRPGTILASNTSTLDIDQIAAATSRPENVCGMHFFSPAQIMRLVEVVRGEQTAPDVIVTILAIAKRLKKLGAQQRNIDAQEIVDRGIVALIVEGTRILEEGIAIRSRRHRCRLDKRLRVSASSRRPDALCRYARN